MANRADLIRAINTNNQVRDSCFEYNYNAGRFGAIAEDTARERFERGLETPETAIVLLDTYLPEYNRVLSQNQNAGQSQNRIQRQSSLQTKLTKAAGVTVGGLALLVLAQSVDNETAQNFAEYVGVGASAGGIVGGLLAYAKHKIF